MKTKNICIAILVLAVAFIGQQAKAQFIKIDDFVNAHQGVLVGQTSSGPSNAVWQANGTATVVEITNSLTPGVGTPGSGTPITTNAAGTTPSDGVAYINLPVVIPTSSTVSTVFMQFDMGNCITTNNINWDIAPSAGGDGGGAQSDIELNANAPNRAGVTIHDGPGFVWFSKDGVNIFVPTNNTVYNVWFVINNSAKTFLMYMQDANPSGTDLPNLTKMWTATTAAAATFPGTPPTFHTNSIAFRNGSSLAINYFCFGSGGTGNTNQYTYSIFEDPNSLDLTNPVTGAAPVSLSPPAITSQPQSQQLYAGVNAVFTVGATGGGLVYQWQTNGVALANGGGISGSTSNALTITGVSAANAVNYSCVITNANISGSHSVTSAVASLTIVAPNGAFETALATASPLHFYAFDDTGSPSSGTEVAFDYEGGDNGIYGSKTFNGSTPITGPRPSPDGFPGFSSGNFAVNISFNGFNEPEHVTVNSPWNLNTNTVTITAWINPSSSLSQDASSTIVFNRGSGNDVGGLNYTASGTTLGYTWNNDSGTTSWDSGLTPPPGQWSFVTLVVTPTNATISMMNTNGLISSTHVYVHANEAFGGTTMIGDDSGTVSGARSFIGAIDEVGVFNKALTTSQLQSIFTNASGASLYKPTNTVILLTPSPTYPSLTAQFSSQIEEGSAPFSYNWQVNGVNIPADGASSIGTIFGSATSFLTISNLTVGTNNFTLVTANSAGSYTSSVPATLMVQTPGAPTTIHTLGMEAGGLDWNTGTNWSDQNPASVSAISTPGSTYIIGVNTIIGVSTNGTLERTPGSTNAVFPGSGPVVVQGNGVLIDGNTAAFGTNATTGELRMRPSGTTAMTNFGIAYSDGGTIYFPDLQLAGGQLDSASPSKVTLLGQLDVLSNSTIYVDSGAGGSIRPIQINSFLTSTGTLSYGYLSSTTASNDLIISGTTNTFSGQWNIIAGTLLGNATNSLGTNTITIGTNAALETTYNINNTNANLIINSGRVFLYTSNTFSAMTINGFSVPAGTYSSAYLNSNYPATFPTNWPVQIGSQTGTNTGVGYITLLKTLLPQIIQQPTPTSLSLYPGQTAQFTITAGGATSYQWWFTNLSNVGTKLSDGGTIFGSLSNVLTISSVSNNNAGTYMVVLSNSVGSVTSSIVTLNILTPSLLQTNITMSVVETVGQDWNTGINWSDGNPVSLSVYSEPGSTYTVLSGAALRTPAGASSSVFPAGTPLIITNAGGLILEHSAGAGSIAITNLQLIGGLMDNGADGLATLTGQMAVTNSVTIYTDTNQPPGLVVNFDVPGGIVGGTNYAALGAYPDQALNTYWNPVSTNGTTAATSTNSDGVTTSAITLTMNIDAVPVGGGSIGIGGYGSYNNSAGTTNNTPPALEANYLILNDVTSPGFVQTVVTNTLNNVPSGTYNLYLYGNNGGHTNGYNGTFKQNDWGTTFGVLTDTYTNHLSTSNSPPANSFVQGNDYVVFSNVVVGAGGTITIAWTPNTNAPGNFQCSFNGLQLAAVVAPSPGPRPFAINSLLTGNGTINYNAGDTNFASDLDIAGIGNTFSGQWNVIQGALLGGSAGSLGTNTITVSTNGALETLYDVNNTNAGLVLNGNGKVFLHRNDTFKTLTINTNIVNAGTYTWTQLNSAYPANFPATWPMQTNSTFSTGSGQIIVLSPAGALFTNSVTLMANHSGSSLILSWTGPGGTLQSTTNLPGPWANVGATSPYTNNITPTNARTQFYRVIP